MNMKKSLLYKYSWAPIFAFSFLLLVPTRAFAAECGYSLTGEPPEFAPYLFDCVIPSAWTFLSVMFIAIAVILAMFLLFKTIRSANNPKELELIPQRWMYLIIFALLAIGVGGTLLNFIFNLFDLPNINSYIEHLGEFFQYE